jgi:hypothetical protein
VQIEIGKELPNMVKKMPEKGKTGSAEDWA